MFTFTVYLSQNFSDLKNGGGVSFRYYILMKQILSEHHRIVLLSPNTEQDILSIDPSFLSHLQNKQLLLVSLPTCTNRIYPSFHFIYLTLSIMLHIYQCLRRHLPDVFLCADTPEAATVLHLARVAGIPSTLYGIHTNLHPIIDSCPLPSILHPILHFSVVVHHTLSSWSASQTATSSEVFRKQLLAQPQYRFLRVQEVFESPLWSPVFRLPLELDDLYREKLTQGQPHVPLLVYVGIFSSEKRIHLLPPALPKGWKLAIIGDGPDRERFTELKSPDIYVLPEFQSADSLAKIYQCADFVVSASDFETLGFTAIESIACGTPVAVQKTGGFLEHVLDEENGLLLDYAYPEQCQQRLLQFHPQSTAYRELQRTTRLYAQQMVSTKMDKTYTERFMDKHIVSYDPPSSIERLVRIPCTVFTYLFYRFNTWVFG